MADSNEIENKRTLQRINEIKSWFFEKINKVVKPPAKPKERWGRPKLIKLDVRKGILYQILMKFRGSLGNTSKTCILIN
jgi:hypothetical protein